MWMFFTRSVLSIWGGETYVLLTPSLAGGQIQYTEMFIAVTIPAVHHLSLAALTLSPRTMERRLMIICIRSWSSKTHSVTTVD